KPHRRPHPREGPRQKRGRRCAENLIWRCLFFFFKQKTAYEIGLGIPAEPLFRSSPHPTRQFLTESLVDGERSQSKSFSSCARIGRIFSFSASSPLRFNS